MSILYLFLIPVTYIGKMQTLVQRSNHTTNTLNQSPLLDSYGREFQIPDFKMKEIYEAIPSLCFKRSTYLIRDILLVLLSGTLAHFIIPMLPENIFIRFTAWFLYTFVQGLFGTGVWVLAHECGHGAFSPSKVINNCVGWAADSALLVPFFSWKYSHGCHHKTTGHLDRDTVFIPHTCTDRIIKAGKKPEIFRENKENDSNFLEILEETPLATLISLIA